jgi:hypothetical protein
MSLDIKKEMDEIRKMYSEDKTQDSFNLLLLGETAVERLTCYKPAAVPFT